MLHKPTRTPSSLCPLTVVHCMQSRFGACTCTDVRCAIDYMTDTDGRVWRTWCMWSLAYWYEATLRSVHHSISVQCSEAYTNPHVAIEQAPIVLRHGHSSVRHQMLLPIHDNLLVCTHDTHTHGTHVSFAQGEKGSGCDACAPNRRERV